MSQDLSGQRIGPFELSAALSSDSLIESYSGADSGSGQFVTALVGGRHLPGDHAFSTRFRREARALAALRHPSIAPLRDYGAVEGGHYLIIDYAEGETLTDALALRDAGQRSFDPSDVTFIVRQLASALEHAHRAGIVHGAVSPPNVLITRSGQARLTHFGAALLYSRVPLDARGAALFSPPVYLAPEQLTDPLAALPVSDIYSLGLLIYNLAAGCAPFGAALDVQTALLRLAEPLPDPRTFRPDMSEAVAEVIMSALALEPGARISGAMSLVRALERAYQPPRRRRRAARADAGAEAGPADPQGDLATGLEKPLATGGPVLYPHDEITLAGERTGAFPPLPPLGPDGQPIPQRTPADRLFMRRAGPETPEARRRRLEATQAIQEERAIQRALSREQRKLRRSLAAVRQDIEGEPQRQPRRGWLPLLAVLALLAAAAALAWYSGLARPLIEGSPLAALAPVTPSPSATATATPTQTPTPTATATATPLAPAIATPLPAIGAAPLGPGTPAFRLADGAVMLFVPAGVFQMGTSDTRRATNAQPQHAVQLSDYWIDRTEVTNAQYALCVEAGICQPPIDARYFSNPAYDAHPVSYVAYDDAAKFCLWLSIETSQPVGLPTEAQWEKAAAWDPATNSAGLYPWGDDRPTVDLLHFDGNSLGTTEPVGAFPDGVSPYGALDMAGNVWEWVADWFDADYYKRSGVAVDPQGPASGTSRITRGGSFRQPSNFALSTARNPISPTSASNEIGFRCTVNSPRPPEAEGFYLSPLALVGGLQDLLVAASTDARNDQLALESWNLALPQLEEALQAGDNNAALGLLTGLEETLADQSLQPALRSLLARSLAWMRSQVRPIETDGTG